MDELRFDNRVAIVTGAGGGLGREYALLIASRGGSVVVNDLGGTRSGEGSSSSAADKVVEEIRSKGGKAVADYNSVEDGEKIVRTALDNFGRIDILINNAGILRDKSFLKITTEDWDLVHRVHLRGSFLITKAAWPHFRNQNYGRIVMTSSTAGINGNFGQSNYGSAKLGLLGLSNTLAVEGAKYNIHCNTIIPVAASRLTEDILPPSLLQQFRPSCVAPVTTWLCHESCAENGATFEAAGGWVGKYRWQRSSGKTFIPVEDLSPEAVRDNLQEIVNMEQASYPVSTQDHMTQLVGALMGNTPSINEAKVGKIKKGKGVHQYTVDDAILYALGVGVSTRDPDHLRFLYECNEQFSVLPTFGVIPSMTALFDYSTLQDALKKYNLKVDPTKLLHGEQYLEVLSPLPPSGTLISRPRIVDVLDKGSGALVIAEVDTFDENGTQIFYNQFALFLIGSGNFGGNRQSDNQAMKHVVDVPKRAPDASVLEQTSHDQAALYRLCGDKNPLHIDPIFASVGGFQQPIMHGLCSMGYATRHVLGKFANNDTRKFKAVKARFAGTILPGQTIQTDMWREGNRIHFQSFCKESGKPIITGAYIDLFSAPMDMTCSSGEDSGYSEDENVYEDYMMSVPVFEEIGRRIELLPELCRSNLKTPNGALYEGESKSGEPNCIIHMSDEDMVKMALGQLDPMKGFIEGKIKVEGNAMLTQKLQPLFELDSSDSMDGVLIKTFDDEAADSSHMEMMPTNVSASMNLAANHSTTAKEPPTMLAQGGGGGGGSDGGNPPACRIDLIFDGWLGKKVTESHDLIPIIKTVYQWNITKNGKIVSVWTLDVKNGNGGVYRGSPKTGKADCTLTIDDDYAVEVFEGREDAMRAFMTGKLKITGNILAAQKLQQLWAEEVERPRAHSSETATSSTTQSSTSSSPTSAPAGDDKALLDSIPNSGLKSDIVFNVFKNRLHEEPDLVRRLRVVFQFNITRDGKPAATWTADNKSTQEGDVYPGLPREGVKPDCTVTVEDDDFLKLMVGKLNPQRAFMMGKLKIKGNIMLLQKLNSLWLELQKLGKAPELPFLTELMLKENVIAGLRSEAMIVELIQRLVRLPELCTTAHDVYLFNMLKDGKPASKWTLDFTINKVIGVFSRGDPKVSPAATLTMDDDDFVRLTYHRLKLDDAISSGRVKVQGDTVKAKKLGIVFSTPTTKPRL